MDCSWFGYSSCNPKGSPTPGAAQRSRGQEVKKVSELLQEKEVQKTGRVEAREPGHNWPPAHRRKALRFPSKPR